ncbi:MAG: hypothetical protein H6553_12780 [Chitinophagales bacterium]|nr:hypothetical protein [Chitinophagales bacterium]
MQIILSNFKLKLIAFVIIGTLFFTACKKEKSTDSKLNPNILFQVEYYNMAWAYTHLGIFIDENGNVLKYNLSNNYPNNWKRVDSLDYISSKDLLSNINFATIDSQINVDTLLQKATLIQATINGTLSDIQYLGADIGLHSYYCYYWDSNKNKYKRQLLFVTGDYQQYNTTAEAIELTEYLKTITF